MMRSTTRRTGCATARDTGRATRTPSTLVILLLAAGTLAPAAIQGQSPWDQEERVHIVTGGEGLEARNGPIRVGEGVVVTGSLTARNGAISVGAGSEVGSVESRNGRISLGLRTVVRGGVSTRNGRVTLERGASVSHNVESRVGRIELADEVRVGGSVESRNGSVTIGRNVRIEGAVATRNGTIRLEPEAWVRGPVTTRNGTVRLDDAHVAGDIDVRGGGDLHLLGGSQVEGNVIVLMPEEGWSSRVPFVGSDSHTPLLRIHAGVRIGGRLILDERVRLEIAPGADVPEPEFFASREDWRRVP